METDLLDPAHPDHINNNPNKGWIPMPEVAKAYAQRLPNLQHMVSGLRPVQDDKPVVLTNMYKKVTGKDIPCGPQGIGDCVSFGNACGLNTYQGVMIATGKANYVLEDAATESIYALGRCEVGGQWNSYQDGACGAWMSESMTRYGCLSRVKIGPYDPKRAKSWGAKGLPDDLEPEAKLHLYKTAVLVTDYSVAVQLIQAGYPVVVCSNQGFGDERDQDGFLRARGTWNHCMCYVGCRFDREGLLCCQSWGSDVPSGPQVFEQSPNSFWIEKSTVQRMLSQRDTYCYNGDFSGFKPNDAILDWSF